MHWFAVLKPNDESAIKTRQKIVDFGFFANHGYGFSYGDEAYSFYTSVNDYGGAITTGQAHSNGTDPVILSYQIGFTVNQKISFNGSAPSSTQAITLAALGAPQIDESATHQANIGPFTIGRQAKTDGLTNDDGRYYSGFIGEIIGFSDSLTTVNKNKVETYLALKYGMTLTHNYIADIGGGNTTIYDISTYGNDIAGVAQDNTGQGFNHLTSQNINAGTLVKGTISDANIDDEEYVIWGHDNNPITLWLSKKPIYKSFPQNDFH